MDDFLSNLDFIALRLYRLGEKFDYEPEPPSSILAEAHQRGESPRSLIHDSLLLAKGKELLYFPVYNYAEQNLDAVHKMLTHPLALPGLGDGGAHVGIICDASFPTFMLYQWTRDRVRGPKPP